MKKFRKKNDFTSFSELFNMFRDVCPDISSCVQAVKDAQRVYFLMKKQGLSKRLELVNVFQNDLEI